MPDSIPADLDAHYERSRTLVEHLLAHPEVLPFPCTEPVLVETHISWVLLCGEDVLKLKKPVLMGFIDFSTLARRDRFAHEELRLNRRLAPELYIDVIRITGTPEAPRFDGEGALLEPAVHMRQFDPRGQLDLELERGSLAQADLEQVARRIAEFQAGAPRVEAADEWGHFAAVMAPIRENFVRVREASGRWSDTDAGSRAALDAHLDRLEAIAEEWGGANVELIAERRALGFVREGHGDLHLGNIARTQWGIRAFDCLEFTAALRWLDVVSDLAFLFMDLVHRERSDLAWRLINAWVARTGDFQGLRLLPFYTFYRIMVRVKVTSLRRIQLDDPAQRAILDAERAAYLRQADAFTAPIQPSLILTHGASGSGKSHGAEQLAAAVGAVHVRSDVERKRAFGLSPEARPDAAESAALYSPAASDRTYDVLEEIARGLLGAGVSVIVDATFLEASRRQSFADLAQALSARAALVSFAAPESVLRARIRARAAAQVDASDADEDVLTRQLATADPLGDEVADCARFQVGDESLTSVCEQVRAWAGVRDEGSR